MDDAKIDLIAREVLTSLKKARSEGAGSTQAAPPSPSPAVCVPAPAQPAQPTPPFHLQLLSVKGGVVGSPCVIQPDKACVGSLLCRSLGH